VQVRVLRVPALVDEILRRLMGASNLDEFPLLRMIFTEVSTRSTLSIFNVHHQESLQF
jgi:hypothetical protein